MELNKFHLFPKGVERMTIDTQVGPSTTELKEALRI